MVGTHQQASGLIQRHLRGNKCYSMQCDLLLNNFMHRILLEGLRSNAHTEDTEASFWDDIYRIGEHIALLFYGFPIAVAVAVSSSSCKSHGKGIVSSELMLALVFVSVEAFF